jgi:transposase
LAVGFFTVGLVIQAACWRKRPACKSLSVDLRRHVVDAIERGLSCRKAAERFEVTASSAIRWRERFKTAAALFKVKPKRETARPQQPPSPENRHHAQSR